MDQVKIGKFIATLRKEQNMTQDEYNAKAEENMNELSKRNAFIFIISIILVVLKLKKKIDWPWLWVLSPLWMPLILVLILVAIVFNIEKIQNLRQITKGVNT